MKLNKDHYEKYGTIILEPEDEAEKDFLHKLFSERYPTTFGLNADYSLSIITEDRLTRKQEYLDRKRRRL